MGIGNWGLARHRYQASKMLPGVVGDDSKPSKVETFTAIRGTFEQFNQLKPHRAQNQ